MMGAKTSIEWTDSTWNPIRGCSRVSEGCRNCYAERLAVRFTKPGLAYEGLAVMQNGHPHWTGKIEFVEKHLLDPLKWGPVLTGIRDGDGVLTKKLHRDGTVSVTRPRPRRIFVNSMSDLFHENVTDEMRDMIFAVMALCPQHIFQVLTKRPARMLEYLNTPERIQAISDGLYNHDVDKEGDRLICKGMDRILKPSKMGPVLTYEFPLPNVWLGVSVENQDAADDRIESLLRTPAAVRFISAEPLLGPINLGWVGSECDEPDSWDGVIDALRGKTWIEEWDDADGRERTRVDCQNVPKLDWVICGGESGPGARPMQQAWARSLRDQCLAAGVPFFFKQWGEWVPTTDPKIAAARGVPLETCMSYVGKKNAGALLDGVEWKQFPEVKGE